MTPDEWDRLPWHEQDMYREGFEDEGLVSHGAGPSPRRPEQRPVAPAPGGGDQVLSEQVHRDGGTTVTERVIHNDLSGRPGEFAAVGLHEVTLGR